MAAPPSWQDYLPWLRRLRWIDPLEAGLAWVCAGATMLAAVLWGWRAGAGPALLLVTAHLLLLIAVVLTVRRGLVPAGLGTLLVSALNCAFAAAGGTLPLAPLTWAYAALGLAAIAVSAWCFPRLRRRLSVLAQVQHRDDFRWLVTSAPLAARWWMQRVTVGTPAEMD